MRFKIAVGGALIASIMMIGMGVFLSGCGKGVVSAPGTPQTAVTPQAVISYVSPWLEAGAQLVSEGGAIAQGVEAASGQSANPQLALAVNAANAALTLFKSSPTPQTQAALSATMAPVYSATTAAAAGSNP